MKRLILFISIVVFLPFSSYVEAKSWASEFRDATKAMQPEWRQIKPNITNCYLGYAAYPGNRLNWVDQHSISSGLRKNDIILKMDDTEVFTRNDRINVLGQQSVGETIKIDVSRDGNPFVVNLKCRDGSKYVEVVQGMYDAILKKKWSDCIQQTYALQRFQGANTSFVARTRLNCNEAKRRMRSPSYDDAQLAYTYRKLTIEEATGSEPYLNEIEPDIFKATDWLRQNNFNRLAQELESSFREAETETDRLTHSPNSPHPGDSLTGQNVVSSGTCFFVDGFGTAVTNHHVVNGSSNIEVVTSDGSKSSAKLIKASDSLDTAVLSTGHMTPNYLSLAKGKSLSLGQDVFTIGYPVTSILGSAPKYSEGTISALSGLRDDDSWVQMSTPIQPGNSGGPLVNHEGQVVGIVTATAAVENFFSVTGSLPQNVNWAIKAEYARPLISSASDSMRFNDKQAAISHTQKSICRVIVR